MRLGLWNRLAIAATVLALLIAPVWIMFSIETTNTRLDREVFDLCSKAADQRYHSAPDPNAALAALSEDHARCSDHLQIMTGSDVFHWPFWRELAGGTLIACAIIYALIWLAVSVGKWVIRGKNTIAE